MRKTSAIKRRLRTGTLALITQKKGFVNEARAKRIDQKLFKGRDWGK